LAERYTDPVALREFQGTQLNLGGTDQTVMAYRRQLGNNVGTAENSSDEDSFTVEEQVDEEIPSNG
jgi:hypothetical protein